MKIKESIYKVNLKGGVVEFVKARNEAHAERIASRWGKVLAIAFACADR